MKKIFTCLMVVFLLSLCIQKMTAQNIGTYAFTQSNVAYSPIVGGTTFVINGGGGTMDDGYSLPLTIPFNFNFGGTVFTSFIVTTNGTVILGQTTAVTNYTPLNGTDNNIIAFIGRDLDNTVGPAVWSYVTQGTTPNRIYIIQGANFYQYGYSTYTGNAQIWLYETSNNVEIHYGTFVSPWASGATCQVGLRGTSTLAAQVRCLSGVGATTWTAPTVGNVSTSTMDVSVALPVSGLMYKFFPPPPCVVPSAQATALIMTPSTTTMNVSFTPSATADSYLAIRSLSSTLSATPVNGTIYVVGAAFGGGIVDYWGPGPNFTSTLLTPNTLYYYYIFAANNNCAGSPPLYLTTSPLTGNQTTLPVFPISGTKNIGPTGDFFTLTAAFAYLNANGVNGALNLVLQSTYVSSVEPAFPIPALSIPGASATNTVRVYPSVTGLSITSASATGTINLTGASYVTFDGRVNGAGAVKDLVIENSSSGYAVQFVNGATFDGVKYCVVKGASQTATNGTITFGSTTATVGNNNNVIDNCEIRDGVSNPLYAIYSSGSTSPILFNSNNTISNCLIHDFYAPAGGNPIGVGIMGGTTAWTITGNSFYQVTAKSPTVANGYNVIFIAAGDGYTITNNYIGGSAASCGGAAWTLNGNGVPPTIANFIYGIRFQTGALTVNPSSIQGNTMANILLYTNPSASSIYFTGIISVVGIQNIGDVTPNIFGAATGTGSITINVGLNASGYNPSFEGIDFRGIYGNVMNNVVGSWTLNPPAGSASTLYLLLRLISVTPTVQNANCSVSGNLVGSLTTPLSIQCPSVTFPPVIMQGILVNTTGSGAATMTVSNNTVANMSNLSSHATSYMFGIYNASSTVPFITAGNTIRDMTTASQNLTIAGSSSIVGLYSTNNVPGDILRSNTIYNLSNTEPALAVGINGMYIAQSAGNLLIEKNFLHNITTASSSALSQVNGIYLNCSGTYVTAKNNMIQLGINIDGSANTASSVINGYYEAGATRDSVLFNSIYIGGAPAAVTTGSTYAFNSVIAVSLSTPRIYMNNIFFNSRSGGTTGEHYGIKVAGTTQFPLGLTSNYNLIISNGAVGGVFGSFNAVDQLTFAAWKNTVGTDLASGNVSPNFIAPNGNTATANLHVQSPTPIEAAGIALANVTDDFDSQVRSTLTPTDVGADAGNFTLSADAFGPNITYVPIGNGLVALNRVLTNWATITDNVGVSIGASLPRIYYKKSTDANAFVGNLPANNGWKYVLASNSSSPFSFTIDYTLLQAAVAAGDVIQYFVVAQDAANNLSSWYPMAGASGSPPVQNINASPTNFQSYTIVTNSIPTTITVPGTYATLTGTGGAFDMINQGVVVGKTYINITADLTEPGTVALNAWAEDPPGSNYKVIIQPDASTLRTISGTATLAAGTGLIRTNGASRFTINGGAGKLLTFRFTNIAPASNQPTIQFNNGSVNDTLENCTIESNSSSSAYGSVNIGYLSTAANIVVIQGNNIRDATAGTTGLQAAGIVSSSILNSIKILNNNIYNFNIYGFYTSSGVADGAVITGNSFYFNSALVNTSTQYCIYFTGSLNNHTISGNYMGGQAPLCAGAAWNNTTTNSWEGIYASFGVIIPSTISNNTIQNINLSNVGSAYCYAIYITGGVVNILNNLIGSTTVPGSITSAGTGSIYGLYASISGIAATSVQGNTITGLNCTSASAGYMYLTYFSGGLFKVGTVTPNVIGSNTVAGSITYNGTGGIYGLYMPSSNPGNAIENNIIGNWSLTAAAGSPYMYVLYFYSANVRKNKIFSIGATNAGLTPYIYGMYNYGASGVTNEISNNLVSFDAGAATNPYIYAYYDGSYTTSFFNLYYNDFYVSGPATTTSSTYAFDRGVAAFYTLRNNIFANKRLAGGTGKHYAVYVGSTGVWSSNYNDFYSTAGPLGYYNALDQSTMATWQTATGGDYNSQNADPQFVSSTDLHSVAPALNNAGVAIPAVTTDYAGVTRGTPPDIGAYEFSLVPVITTVAASGITTTGATLNGTVNSNGEFVLTGFDYGLTIVYGSSLAGTPATISSIVASPFNGAASGLQPNTLYHFRAKGTYNSIPVYGGDLTFTTLAAPPIVVTTAATAIGGTTATLNGTVNANNASTTVSFDYGLTVAYGTNVPGVPLTVSGSTVTPVLANITGLLPCTLYHFRVNGVNAGGTANGNDLTFTTNPAAPFATTLPATGVGNTTATLNGSVTANCLSTTVSFNYGPTVAYGSSVPGTPSPLNGNIATAVSANLTGLTTGVTYHYQVCGTNANGTTCGSDMTFTTACPIAGPAGPITGPSSVCQGGCNYVYTVAPITNATTYTWVLPVGGSITAGTNTNSITVCYSPTALSGNLSVFGTAACGSGAPSYLLVTINPPAAPTIAGPASVCVNSTGNVYTTQSGMTNYSWTVSAGGTITGGGGSTNNTVTVTWTTAGAKTVCVNYNSALGCPALAPVCYNVTVNPLPTPTITGPNPSCTNVPGIVYSTQAGNTSYVWSTSAGGMITGGLNTNAITVLWTAAGAQTVSVNYTNSNGCTAAAPTVYPVTVNATTIPVITGSNNLCVNSGYFNYTTQSGMSNYIWTVSGGGTLNTGQGTNTIQVSWNTPGAQSVSVTFTNASGCSPAAPTVYPITVNPLPDAAGGISGTLSVCAGATNIAYSVLPIANALTYVWTLPAGATIASGSGTNLITVNFALNASSGNITVYGNNTCGDGPSSPPFPVTVTSLPADAGTITGSPSVCKGSTGVLYSVLPIANASGYTWTLPAGATIASGNNTNSITVDFGPASVSGNITVVGTNSCGTGNVSPNFAVMVNPIPQAPVITPVNLLAGDTIFSSAPAGNQWYFDGTLIPGATGQYYVTNSAGLYFDIVTLNGCSSDTSNIVYAHPVGISEKQTGSVNIYPVPNDGLFKLSLNSPSKQIFNLSVYNYLGIVIFEQKNIEVSGLSEKIIDLRPAPNGVYSIVLKNNQQQIVKKIVVNK